MRARRALAESGDAGSAETQRRRKGRTLGEDWRVAVRLCTIAGGILAILTPAAARAAMMYNVVDLDPAGVDDSYAHDGGNGKQAGWGQGPATGGPAHALMW